jgi:hypothetical protein
LPEFEVTVLTVRSGAQTFRVRSEDATAARNVIESDLRDDRSHCPAEWCIDDVQSEVVEVKAAAIQSLEQLPAPSPVP